MIPVKICGLTRREDAQLAVDCGAQALGFIFAASKRQVNVATVREITSRLTPLATKIGVFINEDPLVIKEIMRECRLDLAQLHGTESPDDCEVLEGRVIKTFKAGKDLPEIDWRKAGARGILLDTFSLTAAGGTGETFDWSLVAQYRMMDLPIILAGGLTADNVGAAIKSVRPDGLDISSGVEREPGIKAPEKIRELLQAVRKVGSDRL